MSARPLFRRLPGPLDCHGVELQRFHAFGQVWLLSLDLDRLPGVSSWVVRRRDPSITGRRLRIEGGNMHPRLAFTLPEVQLMALTCRGPAAQALFELTSAEIAAGRHFFSGASE